MGKYKKCPRCDLNYILQEEEMCDICKAELGLDSRIVLLDDIIDDDEPLKLCPVCKTNYIGLDEEMCENCLTRYNREGSTELDDDDDGWRSYLDDDDTKDADEEDVIPLEELDEEEDFEEDFEDEENIDIDLDDYPDDLTDEYDDLDDLDDDEEDDEFEDD